MKDAAIIPLKLFHLRLVLCEYQTLLYQVPALSKNIVYSLVAVFSDDTQSFLLFLTKTNTTSPHSHISLSTVGGKIH